MDTQYYNRALAEYRLKTGDQTPRERLPLPVMGQLLRDAQKLKGENS